MLGKQNFDVLHVSLTPAAVAAGKVNHGRRRPFVTSLQLRQQPGRPAAAADKRGFDKVVAQNMPAERRFAFENRQAAAFHKCFDPDNRVVPPVVAVADLPVSQTGRHNRAVNLACELLHAGKKRMPADGHRRRLNNAGMLIVFHQLCHFQHGFAVHQAVCVQNNHKVVITAPFDTEIFNVAAFSRRVLGAAAVIKVDCFRHQLFCFQPAAFFLNPEFRIGGVAQNEHVKGFSLSGLVQIVGHGQQVGEYVTRTLVVNGHQHGCPGREFCVFRNPGYAGNTAPKQKFEKSENTGPEKQRNPCKGKHKQRHHQKFGQQGGVRRNNVSPFDCGQQGRNEHQSEHFDATVADAFRI